MNIFDMLSFRFLRLCVAFFGIAQWFYSDNVPGFRLISNDRCLGLWRWFFWNGLLGLLDNSFQVWLWSWGPLRVWINSGLWILFAYVLFDIVPMIPWYILSVYSFPLCTCTERRESDQNRNLLDGASAQTGDCNLSLFGLQCRPHLHRHLHRLQRLKFKSWANVASQPRILADMASASGHILLV